MIFVLEFGLSEEIRLPTEEEIEELICQTNSFFEERIQKAIGNQSVESFASFIGWDLDPESLLQPVQVTFLSNSIYEETGSPVDSQFVVDAMMVSVQEIMFFIENFVWATSNDNIFQSTTSVNFAPHSSEEAPPLGNLTVDCIDIENSNTTAMLDSDTPTQAPSPSTAETTQSPTVDPTSTPTVDPTFTPTADATNQPIDSVSTLSPTTPISTTRPPVPNRPTVGSTNAPTVMPTTSAPVSVPTLNSSTQPAIPTIAPMAIPPSQLLRNGTFPVRTNFIVSNLDGLTDEDDIRYTGGLEYAWAVLAFELVANISSTWDVIVARSMPFTTYRKLEILSVPGSAVVTGIEQVDCNGTIEEAVCHSTEAEYQFTILDEVFWKVNYTFYSETYNAILNGTFQNILFRENPEVRLYVGDTEITQVEGELQGGGNDFYGLEDEDGGIGGANRWIILWIVVGCMLICICLLPIIMRSRFLAGRRQGPITARLVPPEESAPEVPSQINFRSSSGPISIPER